MRKPPVVAEPRRQRTHEAATEDFKEGPRAFVEKRAPRWTGR